MALIHERNEQLTAAEKEIEHLRAALERTERRLLDVSWSRQEILAELREALDKGEDK